MEFREEVELANEFPDAPADKHSGETFDAPFDALADKQSGEGFDAPPTLERSGSEHQRAVTSPPSEEEGLGVEVEPSLEGGTGWFEKSLRAKRDGVIFEKNSIFYLRNKFSSMSNNPYRIITLLQERENDVC